MHEPDRTLGLMTEAMREGNILDKVILSLAKFSLGIALVEQDRQGLQEVIAYLESAKRGCNWFNNPEVSTDSQASAFSFDTAASSWSREVSTRERFLQDIDSIIDTVKRVSEAKPYNDESLKRARLFFDRAFRHCIERFSKLTPSPELLELR